MPPIFIRPLIKLFQKYSAIYRYSQCPLIYILTLYYMGTITKDNFRSCEKVDNLFYAFVQPYNQILGDFIWYQSSYYSKQSESNLRHLNFDPYPSRTRGGP